MTFAGLVPLIGPFLADKKSDWPEGIALLGFFGGAAIATALSFHNALGQAGGASLLTSRLAETLAPREFETDPLPQELSSGAGVNRRHLPRYRLSQPGRTLLPGRCHSMT